MNKETCPHCGGELKPARWVVDVMCTPPVKQMDCAVCEKRVWLEEEEK